MSRPGALLMERPELEMRELDVPPVDDAEVEGLIRYRLRSIYPGNPEDTAFDFRILRSGEAGSRRAVIFATRKTTVERYRRETGDRILTLPLTLLLPVVPRRGDFRAWVIGTTWAEHLAFHDGGLCSSTLVKMGADAPFDLDGAEAGLPPGAAAVPLSLVAYDGPGTARDAPAGVTVVSVGELSSRLRRSDGLFATSPRAPRTPASVRYAVLVAVIFVLTLLLLLKRVANVEEHADALHDLARSLEKSGQAALALQKEISALTTEQRELESRTPRDVYALLSELESVLGEGARVQTITIQDRVFQVDATGSNALILMEGFKSRGYFANVKLSQVVPDAKTGRERFSFSGTFDGH